jgi:hypothetical protein
MLVASRLLLPLSVALTSLLAPAQCTPVILDLLPGTVHAGEYATSVAYGPPGTAAFIAVDAEPGPTFIAGIGMIQLGFTPEFSILPAVIPPSGRFESSWRVPCKSFLVNLYSQALTLDPLGPVCLSNAVSIHVQNLGSCEPPACLTTSTIESNFNGTAIPAGRSIWFNSIVKATNLPNGGVVGYRNAHITFTAGSQVYSLPVPDAVITVTPNLASAVTTFDPVQNQFNTAVPAGYSGNIFLSGLSFPVLLALPGGTNPVVWSGEFLTNAPGTQFQWKWAAAVYTSFSTDYNALCIKPIDGSALNPYANSHHAGTPECFNLFVVGGARGGGGSNFTGSYSATATASCN